MLTDKDINKPIPVVTEEKIQSFDQQTDVNATIKALEEGKSILIYAFYNDGAILLKRLHRYLKKKLPHQSFKEQQVYRSEYHRLSNLILIEIIDQKVNAKKAPNMGWLERFYPEKNSFLLPFPQVQGMNSAWQWYKNGISLPTLRNKLHPYYGVYFPTRFEHLLVFDNWLKRYKGPKKTAIDVGVGCGVLSLQMVQHGFQKVFATDINPNAIVGLTEFMGSTKLSRKIELDWASLFGRWEKPVELIVFNPPWLPNSDDVEGLDKALYYEENLFPEFFASAKKRLLPDGKLLVIFSNLAQITQLTTEHPVQTELENGGRFKLDRCFKKSVKAASTKTKRDAHWRSKEEVELWVLSHS